MSAQILLFTWFSCRRVLLTELELQVYCTTTPACASAIGHCFLFSEAFPLYTPHKTPIGLDILQVQMQIPMP